METQEEKQSNDIVDGKITTFASPAVLAAILDEESAKKDAIHGMVDINEQERDPEIVNDSLESSLNDSLEFAKLQESGNLDHVQVDTTDEAESKLSEFTDQVLDFPKSSTPAQNNNETNSRKVEKPPKPRRPQHIIERNKEIVGKKMPVKTSSYARMHASKTKNKMDEKNKKHGNESPGVAAGSDSRLGNQLEHLEEINNGLDQSSYCGHHASQAQHNLEYPFNAEREIDLQQDSYLNDTYHNQLHGPYYDVSQNSSLNYNTYESSYSYQPTSYARGYQSAVANLRQSHAMAGPISPQHYNPLSTQSAPPGGYGYHRKALISNVHHLYEEDSYLSSALPNDSERGNKIPESSLHRKFSSEPYLVQSSSPSLQKMTNIGRNSKASGSYSSLRQPFQYKPYTLKDYKNIAGANVEHSAGGLGPNVDTDEYKEKMSKISKQREYAAMLRSQHSAMRKQQERKASGQVPVKPKHVKEAEIKRQAALNYAKNVPKPKQMTSRKRESPGSGQYRDSRADDNQEITILEILRMRHEKEKKEVDTIRKDLASKIRL
ncbi:hypothetical protein ACROYT_G029058 [Oculina patagonica]